MTGDSTAKAVLFDLDGTLINVNSIAHLIGDWDAFAEASVTCPPAEAMCDFARQMQRIGEMIIVTGKSEAYRHRVIDWLAMQGIMPDLLLMRPLLNSESDITLKIRMVEIAMGADWSAQVLFAVEDRDKMVEAWRAAGITCLQCAPSLY